VKRPLPNRRRRFCLVSLPVSAGDQTRGLGCGAQLFGNFFGFFRVKIHWDLDAIRLNKQSHHAQVGWTDLHVCFDVAFAIDTPFALLSRRPIARLGASPRKRERQAATAGSADRQACVVSHLVATEGQAGLKTGAGALLGPVDENFIKQSWKLVI